MCVMCTDTCAHDGECACVCWGVEVSALQLVCMCMEGEAEIWAAGGGGDSVQKVGQYDVLC